MNMVNLPLQGKIPELSLHGFDDSEELLEHAD